jgi:hypothetical protein
MLLPQRCECGAVWVSRAGWPARGSAAPAGPARASRAESCCSSPSRPSDGRRGCAPGRAAPRDAARPDRETASRRRRSGWGRARRSRGVRGEGSHSRGTPHSQGRWPAPAGADLATAILTWNKKPTFHYTAFLSIQYPWMILCWAMMATLSDALLYCFSIHKIEPYNWILNYVIT